MLILSACNISQPALHFPIWDDFKTSHCGVWDASMILCWTLQHPLASLVLTWHFLNSVPTASAFTDNQQQSAHPSYLDILQTSAALIWEDSELASFSSILNSLYLILTEDGHAAQEDRLSICQWPCEDRSAMLRRVVGFKWYILPQVCPAASPCEITVQEYLLRDLSPSHPISFYCLALICLDSSCH